MTTTAFYLTPIECYSPVHMPLAGCCSFPANLFFGSDYHDTPHIPPPMLA